MIIETWHTERVDNEDGTIEYTIYRTLADKDKPALVNTHWIMTIYEDLDSEDMFDAKGIANDICRAMNAFAKPPVAEIEDAHPEASLPYPRIVRLRDVSGLKPGTKLYALEEKKL